jgi:hypothetical protein
MMDATDLRAQTRVVQLLAALVLGGLVYTVAAPGATLVALALDGGLGRAVQTVAVQNNYLRALRFVEVACDFVRGGRVVDAGMVVIRDVGPFATAYGEVTAPGTRGADRADCRITGIE